MDVNGWMSVPRTHDQWWQPQSLQEQGTAYAHVLQLAQGVPAWPTPPVQTPSAPQLRPPTSALAPAVTPLILVIRRPSLARRGAPRHLGHDDLVNAQHGGGGV